MLSINLAKIIVSYLHSTIFNTIIKDGKLTNIVKQLLLLSKPTNTTDVDFLINYLNNNKNRLVLIKDHCNCTGCVDTEKMIVRFLILSLKTVN